MCELGFDDDEVAVVLARSDGAVEAIMGEVVITEPG